MKRYHRIIALALLSIGLGATQISAQSSSAAEQTNPDNAIPGLHDFDFLFGRWQVHHRKLKSASLIITIGWNSRGPSSANRSWAVTQC